LTAIEDVGPIKRTNNFRSLERSAVDVFLCFSTLSLLSKESFVFHLSSSDKEFIFLASDIAIVDISFFDVARFRKSRAFRKARI
jgi:hypothetical protein